MASDKSPEEPQTRRQRILHAAFCLFMERGYAGTSTLAIASRAKLSKRDLYAEFPGKREILAACIDGRASRMRAPLALPAPRTGTELIAVLTRFGTALRMGVADAEVIATFRLAVQEAHTAPELADALDAGGRAANWRATVDFMAAAQARGLLGAGDPHRMAVEFLSLAVGDTILQNLLGRATAESEADATRHARLAAAAVRTLHPAAAVSKRGKIG